MCDYLTQGLGMMTYVHCDGNVSESMYSTAASSIAVHTISNSANNVSGITRLVKPSFSAWYSCNIGF